MSIFYKLLVTADFDTQLRLPPQFVHEHADILPATAKLRVESGEYWIVRIERIGKFHFFTVGWEKFCRDLDLEFQQFLLFKFDGESGFTVSAYGINGYKRDLLYCDTSGESEQQDGYGVASPGDSAVKSGSRDEDVDEEPGFRAGKQWQFRAEVKKLHETELEVPGDFAKATGIAEDGRIFLLTRHPKSKKWPVIVTTRRHARDQSFAMTVGWNDFLVGSKVRIGSMISFEFLSNRDNVILEANVVKNGKRGFFSPKKRRGRRPKFCRGFHHNFGLK